MQVIEKLSSTQNIRTLSPQELQLGVQILQVNLGFQKGQSVLVVTDIAMKIQLGAIWFEAAKTLSPSVEMLVLDKMDHSGQEPPQEVVDACAKFDITLLHTSFSLTHTQAGKAVKNNGHRGFSLPTVNHEMLMRTGSVDYRPIKELGENVAEILRKGKMIQIDAENGTHLLAKIRQDHVLNDGGIMDAGEIGNLPSGEVFFAPILHTTEGVLVVDGSIADDVLDEPIKIEIVGGIAVKFSGGKAARNLERKLKNVGPDALNVAEIGIGTNPGTNPRGELIEAEKAYGTIHMAFGNSSAIGGEINVPIHLDGVVLHPTVKIDETIIIEKGQFHVKPGSTNT